MDSEATVNVSRALAEIVKRDADLGIYCGQDSVADIR